MTFNRSTLILAAMPFFAAVALAAADTPASMHAIQYQSNGTSEVLQLVSIPRPVPAPGEVLVQIGAAAINPVDIQLRSRKSDARQFPVIPGVDVAGRVVARGAGVPEDLQGRDVYGLLSWRGGAYADYVAVPVGQLSIKPARLSMTQAAAVPLVTLTAWQALFDDGHLTAGQTVLIHGAAGGVGHMAVQLARAAGARVIATASAENVDYVKGLGASVVIDYRKDAFDERVSDVDLVLDTVGGETLARSAKVVRAGGRIVSLLEVPDLPSLAYRDISGVRTIVHPDKKQLDRISELIDEGALMPTVSTTFPLARAAQAQDFFERTRPRGKTVLVVPGDEHAK